MKAASADTIFINGKKWRLDPRRIIGKGGEADVYDIGQGQALKVFKAPTHPDYVGDAYAQQAAQARLNEHQKKLRCFPSSLPPQVVAPQQLATDAAQKIVGYTMPLLSSCEVLLRYGERAFRESAGIEFNQVLALFRALRATVEAAHRAGVVIGDFNDLNVLARHDSGDVWLIDADSFQFTPFMCRLWTARFLDPLLADGSAQNLQPQQPHNTLSDWYAFCVMLMQCLLYVEPYGGLYKPKAGVQKVAHHLRPLHRLTVFHPDVRYPKPALPLTVLPDELLHFFQDVFEKDRREAFPPALLDNLRWTQCVTCKREHARALCPFCYVAPATIKQSITVRGSVTATRIFQTEGLILCALYDGKLRYLMHENGKFLREDGSVVAQGERDAQTRFRLQGGATLIARDDQVLILRGAATNRIGADGYGPLPGYGPVFDANVERIYWAQGGQLWRSGEWGPQYVGAVLANQTLFWCGPKFGFGFGRAGDWSLAFVFDAQKTGLNDNVAMPPITGQLVDATCAFSDERCWLFLAVQEKAHLLHRCLVFGANGTLEAGATTLAGDGSWLGAPLHGKCAGHNFLLAPTDEGVVRVEVNSAQISVTKTFPDTEPFVHAGSRLFAGPDGLYVAGPQEIHVLKIH